MTPWWVNLISVFIGGILGGSFSLWGVKIVQDRTDEREKTKLEAENVRELRKLESDKPSRLRPDRIATLYEVGEMLYDFGAPLQIMFDRPKSSEDLDWMAIAAEAAVFVHRHRKMDIRVRLLFQHDDHLVEAWNTFGFELDKLDHVVEDGGQWIASIWPEDREGNERAHWNAIIEVAIEAGVAGDRVDDAIRSAMKRIDKE